MAEKYSGRPAYFLCQSLNLDLCHMKEDAVLENDSEKTAGATSFGFSVTD